MNYTPPNYHYSLIKSWYRLLKSECECATCKKYNVVFKDKIELHHLDRSTKCDTVSNMVYKLAPLDIIMAETLKCIPLCKSHHLDYHQNEKDKILIYEYYNFEDDEDYISYKSDFDANAWLLAPPVMKESYIKFLENNNEICARQDKRLIAPSFSHR